VYAEFKETKPPLAPILNLFINILRLIRRRVNLSLGLGRRIIELVPIRFREPCIIGFEPLKEKTFLDFTDSTKINVPYYNHDDTPFTTILLNFKEGRISLEEAIKRFKVLYKKQKEQILREIEKNQNVNVTFAYMNFPDALQHFLFTRPLKIRRLYMDLNSYVSILKSKIKDPTLFLIVSDHGFNLVTGTHSKHGFYSSNMALNPKPKQITDFYRIILHVASNAKGD